MCGILCEICLCNNTPSKDDQVLKRLRNRGPNCTQTLEMSLSDGYNAFFCGAVLWMQGPQLTPQPLETEQGVLLYNGDIFDESWPSNINDTLVIMEKLNHRTGKSTEEYVLQQLKTLKGPFAIIYYDKLNRKLFFMRDRIGRSTLLFKKCDNSIIISSILGRNYDCIEVPATHIQILSLSTNMIKLCPWDNELGSTQEFVVDDWLKQMRLQQSLPDDEFRFQYEEEELIEDDVVKYIESAARQIKCKLSVMKKLLEHTIIQNTVLKVTELLKRSIKLRLNRQPNKCKICVDSENGGCDHCTVGVLFSGGLDCTILALLADKYLPREQSIDLINVALKKMKMLLMMFLIE